MSLNDYRFDGEEKLELRGMNTGAKKDGVDKEDILRRTEKNLGRIEALQDKLYADGRESVLIILQAMDAAGKDSTVKHVMGCVNPQGIDVHSFKQPTSEELSHDYLWRVGVEDYLGSLLFSFVHHVFQLFKAVVVWLIASPLRCDTVCQDLVVEGIQKDGPLPIGVPNFEHGHIRNDDLERLGSIPASSNFVGKEDMFLAGMPIAAFSGF